MARTHKELADILAGRMPYAIKDAAQRVEEHMRTKQEVAAAAAESKMLINDRLLGKVSDDEFAYRLAEDANIRKMVNQLCQQVLQPTPVTAQPKNKTNSFINLGAGVSAFWNEMHKTLPVEIENVSEIENILMCVNAGLDKDMEPDTRKMFLREAGLTAEQVGDFITLSDYVEYEERAKDLMRAKIREELGFGPDEELSENDQLLVDALMEDRMMGAKLAINMDDIEELTFEDVYGISAQDMYELFRDTDGAPTPEAGEQVAASDVAWSDILENGNVWENYHIILNATLADTLAMLRDLEAQAAKSGQLGLTEEDLAFAGTPVFMANDSDVIDAEYREAPPLDAAPVSGARPMPEPETFGFTEEDIASLQGTDEPPQMITDADLAFAATFVEEETV